MDRDNIPRSNGSKQALSLEQWENYYRSGAIATCPTAVDGGYDLEVRQAWVAFFSTLPDGARLLDVGTGNGVIPLIAAETAASLGRRWEIHGSDLARIDPVAQVRDGAKRFAGITFHPGVGTEKLPFEAGHFDAVSGHYALEYTQTAAALAELHRVLKPGGDAQFVVHHADSILLRTAHASLRDSDLVFKETKLYRKLHKLVTMEQATPGVTERATNELRAAIQALKQALPAARQAGGGRILTVALDATQKLLEARKTLRPELAGNEVDRAEADLRASTRRLHDLIEHARDAAAMEALQDEANAAGFTAIERLPQYHGGDNLVGWLLMMRRP